MGSPLSTLEPRLVWEHFDQIRQIPRPSKDEERIRQHVLKWAEARGYGHKMDNVGNVVVQVPASPGREGAQTVVIQGHLDMVCEKNRDTEFDFDTQAIEVEIVDGWVRAKGTTLGADNGIGVAMGMAAADDPELSHGPLELLFTIDEETGLTGATFLDADLITGRTLLNLDSEDWGIFFIGCAGGGDDHLKLTLNGVPSSEIREPLAYRVTVRGGRGGHSGCDIHENRLNAVKLLARVLGDLQTSAQLSIASFDGGDKHNAIPREAEAVVVLSGVEAESVEKSLELIGQRLSAEFLKHEPDVVVYGEQVALPERVFSASESHRLLNLLLSLPNGVATMSREIPILVETSTNLAAVHTVDDGITVLTSTRSSVAAALAGLRQQIVSVANLAGCSVDSQPAYPGWAPDTDSPVLKQAVAVWDSLYGGEPEVTAIHAGLECGVIGERVPGMDMLSFGPTITGPHSPDEQVEIETVDLCYTYLKQLLAVL